MSRRESADRRDGGYSSMKDMLAREQVGKSSTYLKLPKNTQLFKLKAGIMFIDIIPFIAGKGNPNASEGMRHWERTFYIHKSIGVDNAEYICMAKTLGEKCPVCEFRASIAQKAARDEEAYKLQEALQPKERQLFNVIDTKAPDKGIQVWDISKHLFGKDLMKEIRNSDEQDHWDEFWYLEQGFTLKIGVEERSFNGHSFPSVDTIHFKERAKDYPDSILDESPILDECLVIPEYDELEKVFMQTAGQPRRERGEGRGRGDREERGSRDDDRGERRGRGDREERGSRDREPEREERSERRSRDEAPPEREERSERRSRRDEPDEPPREERRGRRDREERSEGREERGGREDKDAKDKEDKGGDDPWAARDRGRKAKDDAPPEREERRSRRDDPDDKNGDGRPPESDERPRVRSDGDAESRRERSGRRDEPDEPRGRDRDDRPPKDFNDFKRGRDDDRGGDREERGGRDRDSDRGGDREERSERRSRR